MSCADSFKTRQLYHGGPVSHRHLHLLHSCPEVEGSNEVLEVSLATSSARVFFTSSGGVLDYWFADLVWGTYCGAKLHRSRLFKDHLLLLLSKVGLCHCGGMQHASWPLPGQGGPGGNPKSANLGLNTADD